MFWPVFLFALFCTVWTKEVLFPKPEKEKPPEKELGEAIAKYLSSLKKK